MYIRVYSIRYASDIARNRAQMRWRRDEGLEEKDRGEHMSVRFPLSLCLYPCRVPTSPFHTLNTSLSLFSKSETASKALRWCDLGSRTYVGRYWIELSFFISPPSCHRKPEVRFLIPPRPWISSRNRRKWRISRRFANTHRKDGRMEARPGVQVIVR